MARGFEDFVADSEDDESSLPPFPTKQTRSSIQTATNLTANKSILPSNISAFTTTERTNISAINSFTSDPIAPAPVVQQSVKPRPKPRPVKKPINALSNRSLPSIEGAPAAQTLSSIQDFSVIAPTIADRAKSRSRKSSQKSTIITTTNIIDIPTDSEDELRLLPSSRSRSKSANSKPNATFDDDTIDVLDTQPTLPIPTSDIHPNPPNNSSQLPPSDPISTVDSKNKRKGGGSTTPSPPIRNKKRRRVNWIGDVEEDTRMMAPPGLPYRGPSPFFAPSSSASPVVPTVTGSPQSLNVEEAPQKKAKKATKKKKKTDDDEEEFKVGSDAAHKRKQKAPAKPRKKKDIVGSQKPERIFKSVEFIQDSVEESGGTPQPKPDSTASASTVDLPEIVMPVKRPSSASDIAKGATKGKKRRKTDEDEYDGEVPEDNSIKPKTKTKRTKRGKARHVSTEEEFEEAKENIEEPEETIPVSKNHETALSPVEIVKENTRPPEKPSSSRPVIPSVSDFARLNYRHSIASEQRPTSMSDLIRKVNTISGSNSASPAPVRTYSPLLKSSRSTLRKIAPLHPNRRTPPPLPPKPPPPKKTKKQLELEEKWEEELEESVEGWTSLTNEERNLLRKAKRDREMGWEE